ncbi:MAG: hypothetical protein ACXWG1_05250 [Usitatibacter sp.]
MSASGPHFLKLVLLLFWTAWFGIVFLTNLFSALKSAGMLKPSWMFASKNYEAVAKAVSIYQAPKWVPALLFAGVVAWQLAAFALFGFAFASSLGAHAIDFRAANAAFIAGVGLWGAFMIADEVTIKYAYEQSHELLFIAQLATLVAFHILP